jgi:hypothetical protein
MHIISIEELIKGIIVFFDGQGFQLRDIKGVDVFFKDHKIRYFLSYTLFVMGIIGDDLIGLLKRVKEDPQKLVQWHKQFIQEENSLEKHYKSYLLRKLVLLKREYEWFGKIDFLRQDGFYSGLKDEIKTPVDIPKEQYDEVIKRMQKVWAAGHWLIQSFETADDSLKDHIANLKQSFTNKFGPKIAEGLAAIRRSGVGPFKHVQTQIENNL